MYGTQTKKLLVIAFTEFENDVKMYGTQTGGRISIVEFEFENDVKMYGTQTSVWNIYPNIMV